MRAIMRRSDVGWALFLLLPLPNLDATRLASRVFTTADGLGRDDVSCIVSDSKGFLWLCTSEGVSRYDGYQFVTYGVAQGLAHRSVNAVLEASGGTYLFATDLGISRLDVSQRPESPVRFVSIPRADGIPSSRANALIQDHAGVVWAATAGGLYRIDNPNGAHPLLQFINLGAGPEMVGLSLREDRNGSLWVGTTGGICRRGPNGRVEWHNGAMPRDTIKAMTFDRNGNLWLGTLSGLWKFKVPPEGGEPKLLRRYGTRDGLASDRIHSLLEAQSDGRIWVGTASSLSQLASDENGREYFHNYTASEGLSGRAVLSLGEDAQGALWAGADHGLARIARNGFAAYTDQEGIGNLSIIQVHESGGDLWAASNQTTAIVLHHLVNGRFIATRPRYPASIGYFGWGTGQVALRDHEGEWWIATGQGLCRFPRVDAMERLAVTLPKSVYTIADGLPQNEIFRLFEDSRGDIWITTLGEAGLSRWDRRSNTIHRYASADCPGVPSVYAQDHEGNLWIGFSNDVSAQRPSGLIRYRDGRFEHFIDKTTTIGWISALSVDRSGRLLVGSTDGGLRQIEHPGDTHPLLASYPTASTLSSITVRAIAEDRMGRVYVATPRGVDRIEPESRKVRHYTTGDGFAGGSPASLYCDRHGRIWIGSSLGLSVLVPAEDRASPAPRVYITGLSVNGEPVSVTEPGAGRVAGLRLQPNQTQLRIEFVGLGGAPGESLQYQYKLRSVDSTWSAPAVQRAVSYARLAPGQFQFLVRAVSAGAGASDPAEVDFELFPPVWRRWWFLASVMAIFSGLALLAHRYDVSRRLELERMRLRIARDLHDDLGASLTRMTILTELASRETQALHPQAGRDLGSIAEMARGMVDALGELVWAVDPRRDDMASTSRRIRRYASDVLEPKGIAWIFETLGADSPPLAPEQRRHVLLIVQEALRNAARHAHCSRVDLLLKFESGEYCVCIRDNGCGLADPIPDLGSGMLNLRSRAAALGGALSIVSSPGEGTALTVRFPCGRSAGRLGRMIMLFRRARGMRSNRQ